MSFSFTTTESSTFTRTHATHLAAKVATDLRRMQRFYSAPSDRQIADFEGEAVELLRLGYLKKVTYGFQRDGEWIEPTLRYEASDLMFAVADDDPGRVMPGKDVTGAAFRSFLTYSDDWWALEESQRSAIEGDLPIQRVTGHDARVANGFFESDKTYTSGGRSLGRSTFRSY